MRSKLDMPSRSILATLLVALSATALVGCTSGEDGTSASGASGDLGSAIKSDRYQAVYLDNERVYFGRLVAVDGDWFMVEDAFFIRQTEAADGKEAGSEVVRITEEVAEPQNDLLVPAGSIDMVQNLSSTSAVAKAIDDVVK